MLRVFVTTNRIGQRKSPFIRPYHDLIAQGTNSTATAGSQKFNYDEVFNSNAPQGYIYEKAVKPIVEGVMEGFNGTVFAYG
jgi:hypothetical protein